MDNLSELRDIWLTTRTDNLPRAAEMLQIIAKYRVKKLAKFAAIIVMALILVSILIGVVFVYRSNMLTTRIGEGLMLSAGLMLVVVKTFSFISLYKAGDLSNKDFIYFLEQTRQRQLFHFKRTQVIALAVCSTGLLFYIFEPVYQQTFYWITAYSLLMVYILVMTFVVRPRVFRRQDKKLNEQIVYLKTLLKQIDE